MSCAVVAARLRSKPALEYDSVAGALVARPGDTLIAEVLLGSEGTDTSDAVIVRLLARGSDSIVGESPLYAALPSAALAATERRLVTLEAIVPTPDSAPRLWLENRYLVVAGFWRPLNNLNIPLRDADPDNNSIGLGWIALDRPYVALRLDGVADTIPVGGRMAASLTMTNPSGLEAGPLPSVGFCIAPAADDVSVVEGCGSPGWAPAFGLQQPGSAGLRPGESVTIAVDVDVPSELPDWLYDAVVVPCLIPPGAPADALQDESRRACQGEAAVPVTFVPTTAPLAEPRSSFAD